VADTAGVAIANWDIPSFYIVVHVDHPSRDLVDYRCRSMGALQEDELPQDPRITQIILELRFFSRKSCPNHVPKIPEVVMNVYPEIKATYIRNGQYTCLLWEGGTRQPIFTNSAAPNSSDE
jgi:hypothetical protein